MAKDIQKQLQVALQKELKPLFIGLRNDLEALLREQKKQTAKKPPAIQKTKITNHPEIQKVEQVNPQREVKITNPQKNVNVNGIKQLFGNLFNKQEQLAGKRDDTLTKLFKGLTGAIKAQVFKVKVENQLELPAVLKVEEQNPTQQKQLQDVRIVNSKPRDAIPVVLVSHDLKRFYDIMVQLVGGSGGGTSNASLAAILTALNKIDANTDQLELKADTVILNVDDLEALIAATNTALATLNAKDFATETTLTSIEAQTALLTFIGDRLKVDAEVVVMAEPRPGLRVAEFLRASGSPDLNVDGSSTQVTFSAAPPAGKKWFIHTISLVLEDTSINFSKFGGRSALANGIEFRVKEAGLAEGSLGVFKKNGDFYIFTSDITFESAATDIFAFSANIKVITGTTFELTDANSDIFKVIVSDNLTSINRFNMLIRGFEQDE